MYKLNIDIILYNYKQIKLKRNENNMKSKLIFVTTFISLALCSCSSGNSIYKTAKNAIKDDLSDKVSINECYYSEDLNAVYVDFSSSKHGNDRAFVTLDDNDVFYESVFNNIDPNDFDKTIEYGDYSILYYQYTVNGGWEEISK